MPTLFRYKDYSFRFNPNRFEMKRRRILKTFQPPLQSGAVIPQAQTQDLGLSPAEVSGEGELIGEHLMEQYTALYDVFLQPGSGLLHVPGLAPFSCYFEALSVIGQAGPSVLRYRFLFLEDCVKNEAALRAVRGYHIFRPGDTLLELAVRYGMDLRELFEKNPHLNPDTEPEEGTTIWL